MIVSITQETLASYLKANMPSVAQVLTEWPSANITLNMPSITVLTKSSAHTPFAGPSVISKGVVGNNQSAVVYLAGQYDDSLQLDLWARSKVERAKLFDEFFKAFNPDVTPMGLRISVGNNGWASYALKAHQFLDSQEGSQRQEWRVKIDVEAQANVTISRTEYVITDPVLEVTVSDDQTI